MTGTALFVRLSRLCARRPRTILLCLALSTLPALVLMLRLRLTADLYDLLPRDERSVAAFRQVQETYGTQAYLLVAIQSRTRQPFQRFYGFADRFAVELRRLPELEFVDYRRAGGREFPRPFVPGAVLYLDGAGMRALADRLSDGAIQREVRAAKTILFSPMHSAAQKSQVARDPLGLVRVFQEHLPRDPGSEMASPEGYFVSPDRTILLMIARPVEPALNLEFSRRLMRAVRGAEAHARARMAKVGWSLLDLADLEVGYAGGHPSILEEAMLVRREFFWNVLASALGVAVLYLLAFRRPVLLGLAAVPLVAGILWTLAFASATLGQLNVVSAAFSALLIGLGIDFTILIYTRYLEERQAGTPPESALERTMAETGPALLTGAITTTATFYALLFTSFRGLRDLGLLTGTGILFILVGTCLAVPAFLAWGASRTTAPGAPLRPRNFGLGRLGAGWFDRPGRILLVALAAAAALAPWGLRVTFDSNLESLRSERSEAARVQRRIEAAFGRGTRQIMVVAEETTEAAALAVSERIFLVLREWEKKGEVGRIDALGIYLPPPAVQEQRLALFHELRKDDLNPDRIPRAFRAALAAANLPLAPYRDYVDRIREVLSPPGILHWAGMQDPHVQALIHHYVRRVNGRFQAITYVNPSPGGWRTGPPSALVRELEQAGPSVMVTGAPILGEILKQRINAQSLAAAAFSVAVVGLLFYVNFRSLLVTAFSLLALGVGVASMFGLMGLLGLQLTFLNAVVAVMVIGIGEDYMIYVAHRFRVSGGDARTAVVGTGSAVVMAALTTMVGFGSLALSGYPAMASMGSLSLLGIATCLLTSLTLLPACLSLWARPRPAESL